MKDFIELDSNRKKMINKCLEGANRQRENIKSRMYSYTQLGMILSDCLKRGYVLLKPKSEIKTKKHHPVVTSKGKPVAKINAKTGETIKKYRSLKEAGDDPDNPSTSLISRVCHKEREPYKGFNWAFITREEYLKE